MPSAVNAADVAVTRFWFERNDGTEEVLYEYTPEQLSRCADTLNIYRSLLDEDGRVFFSLAPVANTANRLLADKDRYVGWHSSMEEELRKQVSDGVFVANPTEILNDPLLQGEYIYFRTDHHWTALGACYTYRELMRAANVPPIEYNDYRYNSNYGFIGSLSRTRPRDSLRPIMDTTDIMLEEYPVKNYALSELTKLKEVDYMRKNYAAYSGYIGGRQGPWRLFETGVGTGRNAFVIGDSFCNVFVPYVLAHYDRVIMTDVRVDYYKGLGRAGASIREYMDYYDVDDVFIILCHANNINTTYFKEDYLLHYLDQ